MAAARARARHSSRTRYTRSCPQTFQCPARACSPAAPRVNARQRTKPPPTTPTTNLLPGAVVYVAVSILEHALPVLQVIQPLSLVHVTARKRFLALPAYYTASRTHHTSHVKHHTSNITRHTSHITRVHSGSTHHSRPCAAHPGTVVHDAVGVRQLALAVPKVVQVLPLINVSIRKLVPAATKHKSHARTHEGLP
jgi:hypothetical protein